MVQKFIGTSSIFALSETASCKGTTCTPRSCLARAVLTYRPCDGPCQCGIPDPPAALNRAVYSSIDTNTIVPVEDRRQHPLNDAQTHQGVVAVNSDPFCTVGTVPERFAAPRTWNVRPSTRTAAYQPSYSTTSIVVRIRMKAGQKLTHSGMCPEICPGEVHGLPVNSQWPPSVQIR